MLIILICQCSLVILILLVLVGLVPLAYIYFYPSVLLFLLYIHCLLLSSLQSQFNVLMFNVQFSQSCFPLTFFPALMTLFFTSPLSSPVSFPFLSPLPSLSRNLSALQQSVPQQPLLAASRCLLSRVFSCFVFSLLLLFYSQGVFVFFGGSFQRYVFINIFQSRLYCLYCLFVFFRFSYFFNPPSSVLRPLLAYPSFVVSLLSPFDVASYIFKLVSSLFSCYFCLFLAVLPSLCSFSSVFRCFSLFLAHPLLATAWCLATVFSA